MSPGSVALDGGGLLRVVAVFRADQLGQTEVQNLHATVFGEEQVFWL